MTDKKDIENKEDIKAQRYKERQQKVKERIDAKIAAATKEQGVFLVITGNGKGKSTSGFGMVTRAIGHDKKAAVVQFIKGNWDCGERNLLQKLEVPFIVMGTGFTWETQDKELDRQAAQAAWVEAKKLLQDESIDMILFDEMTYMINYGHIDIDEVVEAIANRPKMQHVIITGRGAHRKLLEAADTVSEVQSVKHAFESGVKAQLGFDY
ncbi:cob(I)yrinic acid a,c-diamide adenosyltransferase [Catenovulum sp. SM1970]|uniref:cob(I)yrinic acid a,c-diamide adenosyltransferase n=1 Tax=Marinifaba aquimaris TaxID=2741323 RepID=UPI001572A3BD|nr:cob(I)yrinic acid a,c-diamide adenosyltransferase [Marinifaba aquimaris]NTS77767.1 cob(I)yrinic acid a,c-diamide adenosyltransferase [Marinifaba aquimaris]